MEDEEALLQGGTANPDVQVEVEDEIQDWRNLSKVKDTSLPKRGEKDYEPDGTDVQKRILQDSRDSMFDALAGPRGHVLKQHVRAVWIPSVRRALIEKPKGSFLQTCGIVDSSNKCWLTPEEFCYLAERGTVEPWFEDKDVPMSIQAVYACCFEDEDEIDEYHVYAYLKRHGFIVMRNDPARQTDQAAITQPSSSLLDFSVVRKLYGNFVRILTKSRIFTSINSWLTRIGLNSFSPFHPSHFQSTKYTNYTQIYNSIKLIPFYKIKDQQKSSEVPSSSPSPSITFDIWKPDPKFSKKSPPTPDFQVLVRNTNKYSFPTLSQLRSIFQGTNIKKGKDVEERQQQRRLKEGYRYVLIALIDYGIINFVKVSEADFGSENVWYVPSPKDSKPKHRKKFNK